jgi:polyvinyl alcohol dehydrogenase (cytochrome)
MTLLDRYLRTVGRFLPRARREDIIKELSENLRSRMEDVEAELGRPLTEADQAAILREFGNPLVVAAGYRGEELSLSFGRQLIGPLLFPLYAKILLINLGFAGAVLATNVSGLIVTGTPVTFVTIDSVLLQLVIQFGIVTLIFVGVQAHLTRFPNQWDPQNPDDIVDAKLWDCGKPGDFVSAKELNPKPLNQVSRFESVAQIIGLSIYVSWLMAIARSTGVSDDLAASGLKFAPIWRHTLTPLLLLAFVGIAQSAINLFRPDWTWLRSVARVITGLAWLALLMVVWNSGDGLVVFADLAQPTEKTFQAVENFNRWFSYSLLIVAVCSLAILLVDVARLFRLRRDRRKAHGCRVATLAVLVATLYHSASALARDDRKDWPMYNRDVIGSRHNASETAIAASNVGKLEEKWRFPAKNSGNEMGVVHATPVVVDGYVYFGTATDATFYKLTPDGKVRWSYRNPAYAKPRADSPNPQARFQTTAEGVMGSALVTADSVYFGDVGGWIYALDRRSGVERWKLNTRVAPFPNAHPLNCIFASPIAADGKVIVAGGSIEQVVAAFPGYRGCTGRGFVIALEPKTGAIAWKHELGPKPEPLVPPITIKDSWGDHVFYFGPATSSVWSTPSFDAESGTIFFGTDVNTAPRRPTEANPRMDTRESCAVVALGARDGAEKWVTQINRGDVWTNAMRAYDPNTGLYKDQSIGDTPKIYTVAIGGKPTKVVGVGCKNGGFYVLAATDGRILDQTPVYQGPPAYPPSPAPDPRTLALPGVIGGLQTGCATDGKTVFTNGIDASRLAAAEAQFSAAVPPTAGRVVALSLDLRNERWRHERPKLASLGGPSPKTIYTDVGDPVASGVAVANGVVFFTTVASGKLVALDAAKGSLLKEIDLGPVWSGPSVSRGRVYVGTGNTLFTPVDFEAYFPKKSTGVLYSFGLPGEDEIARLGAGKE